MAGFLCYCGKVVIYGILLIFPTRLSRAEKIVGSRKHPCAACYTFAFWTHGALFERWWRACILCLGWGMMRAWMRTRWRFDVKTIESSQINSPTISSSVLFLSFLTTSQHTLISWQTSAFIFFSLRSRAACYIPFTFHSVPLPSTAFRLSKTSHTWPSHATLTQIPSFRWTIHTSWWKKPLLIPTVQ